MEPLACYIKTFEINILEKEEEDIFPESDSENSEEEKKKLEKLLQEEGEGEVENIEQQIQVSPTQCFKIVYANLFLAEAQFSLDFNKIKEFINSSDWKLVKNSTIFLSLNLSLEPEMKIYSRKQENSSIISVRAEAIQYNKNLFETVSLLKDPEKRLTWDKLLKNFEIIKQLDENSDLLYQRIQPPSRLITSRDYVLYRYYVHNKKHPEIFEKIGIKQSEKNQFLLCMKSVELASHPPNKGIVRAQMHLMLVLIEECEQNPKDLKIYFINNADLKGKIPISILNFMMPKMIPKMMKDLDKAYQTMVLKQKK